MQSQPVSDFSLERKRENVFQQSTNAYTRQTSSVTQSLVSCMPPITSNWNMEAMPWRITSDELSRSGIMQFTAHAANTNMSRRMLMHQKRKSGLIPAIPSKQFISEEKITQHFNGMHISSNYTQHNSGNVSITSMADDSDDWSVEYPTSYELNDYQTASRALEEKLQKANGIIFSKELKRFHANHEIMSPIPQPLLRPVENPCTALVLWQPPPTRIFHKPSVTKRTTAEESMDVRSCDDSRIFNISRSDTIEFGNFPDNNNTCNVDFNSANLEGMDEDL